MSAPGFGDWLTGEGALRAAFPGIPWDQPVQVKVLGHPPGRWVCRYCVALHGLRAADLGACPFAFDTRRAALDHIEQAHHD